MDPSSIGEGRCIHVGMRSLRKALETGFHALQVKQNVQRTLAIELQKLSVQFRKQQKAYLNKLRKTSAASSSFSLLDETGPTARVDEEYDPGFSEIQVCMPCTALK